MNAIRKSRESASCRRGPSAIEFKVHAHEVARPSVDSSEASVQDLFGVSGKDEIIISKLKGGDIKIMQSRGLYTEALFELVISLVVRSHGVLREKLAPDLELEFKFPIGDVVHRKSVAVVSRHRAEEIIPLLAPVVFVAIAGKGY